METNKNIALQALLGAFVARDPSIAARYFTDDYIQQNPKIPNWAAALPDLIARLAPKFSYELGMVVAESDIVMIHGRYKGWEGKTGRPRKRRLTLVVADDGVGVSEQFQHDGRPGHGGIRGMRERARIIGATLSLQNNRPRGTEVVVCLTAGKAYKGARRLASFFGRGGPTDPNI